ncbi:MAG: 7-carboxy-7-deazaguanine synthase QueE [Planctomycetota bacterium]|jgi:7-carboxy-7-deazaguanine synthase
MKVTEIFYSLQGEGFLAGVPSVFVRLSGCALRCKWCDTKYSWDHKAGKDHSISQILETVRKWPCRHVVITGGEPMINPYFGHRPELLELITGLKSQKKHITIETAGIWFVPNLPCDLMSISPKLSNSTPQDPAVAKVHNDSRLDTAVLGALIDEYDYQLKFVVESVSDLDEITRTIDKVGNVDSRKVMLMPQACTRDELLERSPMVAKLCKETGFAFSPRLQVLIWNNEKGT